MHEAMLYRKLSDKRVQCLLCSHYCLIDEGSAGNCMLRQNFEGTLYTSTYGDISGMAIDPIEKKPLYHFFPGSKVLSFGTRGCNFFCSNCQNWQLSQSRDADFTQPRDTNFKLIKDLYRKYKFDGIAYTYSEPTIFFEFARDVILYCKNDPELSALKHIFVSNGYFSKELLNFIYSEGLIDAINLDLKFISDDLYNKVCGASLTPVMDNIRRLWEMRDKIHLEITNLIITDLNDGADDLMELCKFLSSVSKDIPIHFSRFFPQYQFAEKSATASYTLSEAKRIAEEIGLNYVYIGNTSMPDVSDTICPNCHEKLITRRLYEIAENKLKSDHCPVCDRFINIRL